MRNREIWQESKYVWAKGGLWSSADVSEVRIESRFLGDILAQAYASAIQQHARGRLLDLGCGKAPLYGIYRGCTEEIICVDWVNTRHRSPYLDLEQDLNLPLPVAAASIDKRVWQLKRVMDFPNAGDLWLISTIYPDGTVAAPGR